MNKHNEMMLPKFIWSIAECENFARGALKEDALGKINRPKRMPTVLKQRDCNKTLQILILYYQFSLTQFPSTFTTSYTISKCDLVAIFCV